MMDGPRYGAYRIKVTIRYKVRRGERFVEKEKFNKGLKGQVYSEFFQFTTNRFLRTIFSLTGGIIGCPICNELVLSTDIIKEVLSVLSSKFGRDREALSHAAVVLLELGKRVKPDQRIQVLKDEPDNRILECAVFGRAELIVTGDKEMLRLKEYMGIKITSLREYINS